MNTKDKTKFALHIFRSFFKFSLTESAFRASIYLIYSFPTILYHFEQETKIKVHIIQIARLFEGLLEL